MRLFLCYIDNFVIEEFVIEEFVIEEFVIEEFVIEEFVIEEFVIEEFVIEEFVIEEFVIEEFVIEEFVIEEFVIEEFVMRVLHCIMQYYTYIRILSYIKLPRAHAQVMISTCTCTQMHIIIHPSVLEHVIFRTDAYYVIRCTRTMT